jgi:hypothetical protein
MKDNSSVKGQNHVPLTATVTLDISLQRYRNHFLLPSSFPPTDLALRCVAGHIVAQFSRKFTPLSFPRVAEVRFRKNNRPPRTEWHYTSD